MTIPTRPRTLYSFRLPLLFLRGNYLQLLLAVVALTIAVAAVCMIDLVNRAVLLSFSEVVDTMAGRAALQVSAGEGGLFAEEVTEIVAKTPGVELAVPVVTATAFAADDGGETLTLLGVDVANEAAVRVYEPGEAVLQSPAFGIEDPLVFLSQPDSIALTRVFAERRSLRVGERIALETPVGRRQFTVRGLLEPAGVARALGGNLVVMDILAAEAMFTRPGFINRVDVVVKHGEDAAAVARSLAALLPRGLSVAAPEQRKADLHRVIRSFQLLLWGGAIVFLVVCFLIAFNRLSTYFEARGWHAAVLRAVGVRRGAVWRELLKESVLLGAAGVVLGIPVGIVLGRVMLPMIQEGVAGNSKLTAPSSELTVHASSLVIAGVVGMAAALLAAALPSWRSARVAVAETLRRRGIEDATTDSRVTWLLRAGVAALLGAAIAAQAFAESPAWGLVATALIAPATVLLARPLLRLLQRPLMPCLYWLAGPTGPFAWSAILDYPRRTALTIGMIGVGLGSVLWFMTIVHSFERTLVHAMTGPADADLIVTSTHVASGWVTAPMDERILGELAGTPGVAGVAGSQIVEWPYRGEIVSVYAFDPDYFAREDFGRWMLLEGGQVDAVWQAVARGEGVVVSSNFARHFDARAGDRIELETPTGPLAVRVIGTTMAFASPVGTILISRALYASRWQDHRVYGAWLRTAPGADLAAVREAITGRLAGRYRLRFYAAGEMVAYWVEEVRRAFAGVRVFWGLVFVALLAGLADTLVAGLIQRIRELGMARAVGVRRWQLQRMVVVEGIILGGLGLVLAGLMGISLGALWVNETFPYLLGWDLKLYLPYRHIVILVAMTVAVCLAAALGPARRVARLEPAAALRYE